MTGIREVTGCSEEGHWPIACRAGWDICVGARGCQYSRRVQRTPGDEDAESARGLVHGARGGAAAAALAGSR